MTLSVHDRADTSASPILPRYIAGHHGWLLPSTVRTGTLVDTGGEYWDLVMSSPGAFRNCPIAWGHGGLVPVEQAITKKQELWPSPIAGGASPSRKNR